MNLPREGDRVRVTTRAVTEEDRKRGTYYQHLAGLVGTVQNVYGADEIVIKVDPPEMSEITRDVHRVAVERMREKFASSVSEEQKKQLSAEEMNFTANYVVMVRGVDLEKV